MLDKVPYARLRQTPRVVLKDAVPLRAPFTLYVEPTNICNFSCVYCPESFDDFEQRSGGLHRMDATAFARIADQVAAMGGVRTLNLYMMGEPFVNRALPDFIRIANDRGICDRIIVTTNGSLLNEDVARRTIASGLDYLRVSVYGGDAQSFARKTRRKIPLDRVRCNVERFRALRDEMKGATHIYAKMIDSGDAAENARFLAMFGAVADEAVIEPAMNWNDPEDGNLAQIDRATMLDTPYFSGRKAVCPQPFYTLVVHSDLRVSVCCVDWAKEAVVGDLRTETLGDIWRGETLRAFQLAHLERRASQLAACRNCTFLHTMADNLDDLAPGDFLARASSGDR